ncbi:MAG: hypothetical protein LBF54_01065 [Holosporaceae bacterium]|nr:hypothetical protein [Holosporaceae bacterium]
MAEKNHADVSPNCSKIILYLDQINYDIARKIDKFIGKNPDKKKELISLLIKFTENVEEIKRLLIHESL